MKENTHFMAHHHQASAKSDDQIPSQAQPLKLKEPQQPEDSDSDDKDDETEREPVDAQRVSGSETCVCNKEEMALEVDDSGVRRGSGEEISGRERLKRHRVEVAGRVWIPERWGQEEMLKDWIDCSAFDAPLVPSRIMTARAALVQEGTTPNAAAIRIENRC